MHIDIYYILKLNLVNYYLTISNHVRSSIQESHAWKLKVYWLIISDKKVYLVIKYNIYICDVLV